MARLGPTTASATPLATLAALAALGATACSGDHGALATRPDTTAELDAATLDARDEAAGDAAEREDARDADATDASLDVAPAHFAATLVNGLADARAARFCFARVAAGVETPVAGAPIPDAPAGLAFAASTALAVPSGVDAATTALRPYALVGDLGAIGARRCEALLARDAGAAVAALALPVLAPGTLAGDRSVLVVASSCPGEQPAATGNPTLYVVATSRATAAGKLALAALHASAASGTVSLVLVPDGALTEIPLASSLARGALGPRPPLVDAAKTDLGPSPAAARLSVRDPFSSIEMASLPLGAALAPDAGAPVELSDGKGYAFVLLGAQPTLANGGYWNATALAVVPSDP